nr:hypothetical protein [Bacillus pumilus]
MVAGCLVAFAKCQDCKEEKIMAVYLVLIFPANLFAAREGIPFPGQKSTDQALLWIRLIGQPILIIWAMSIAKWEKKLKQ